MWSWPRTASLVDSTLSAPGRCLGTCSRAGSRVRQALSRTASGKHDVRATVSRFGDLVRTARTSRAARALWSTLSVLRLGDRLADLSYANPYGGIQEAGQAILRETLDTDRLLDLQYSPFGGKTQIRRVVADSLRGTHDLPFVFSDVVPGCDGGLAACTPGSWRSRGRGDNPGSCWLDYLCVRR